MKTLLAAVLLTAAIIVSGCSDSDTTSQGPTGGNPEQQLMKVDSGFATGSSAIVALYTDKNFKTGYNRVYVAVYDSATGTPITDAHVMVTPMMDMGTMMHSAPYEEPQEPEANERWFKGSVVFIMPSSGGLYWQMHVHVHNHTATGQPSGEAKFMNITVENESTKYKSITTASGTTLFISMIEPSSPQVGINDLEYTVHKRQSMMSFPADGTYNCTIEPWMPSMGHGSPNNVNPVHTSMGHYNGDVNFTMTGDWQIKVYLEKDGQTDSTYFDLVF